MSAFHQLSRRWSWLLVVAAALVALLFAVKAAQAMEFRNGDTVVVPAGTTIDDDLIATGESVVIAGRVRGEQSARQDAGSGLVGPGRARRDGWRGHPVPTPWSSLAW